MIIVFDVDDTLYGQMSVLLKALDKEFGEGFEFPFDTAQFYAVCREYGEKVFPKVVSGEMSVEECGVYRLRKAFEDFHFDYEEASLYRIHEYYTYSQSHIEIDEDKVEVLQYLQEKKVGMALLTNGPSEHQRKKIKQLGLYDYIEKEAMFVSGEVGVSKPHLGIFEHVENILHASKEELIYIGDSLTNDIEGAKQAGWKVIWVNRRGITLDDTYAYMPDATIKEGDSLLECVKTFLS